MDGKESGNVRYELSFPSKSGTLACLSDIVGVPNDATHAVDLQLLWTKLYESGARNNYTETLIENAFYFKSESDDQADILGGEVMNGQCTVIRGTSYPYTNYSIEVTLPAAIKKYFYDSGYQQKPPCLFVGSMKLGALARTGTDIKIKDAEEVLSAFINKTDSVDSLSFKRGLLGTSPFEAFDSQDNLFENKFPQEFASQLLYRKDPVTVNYWSLGYKQATITSYSSFYFEGESLTNIPFAQGNYTSEGSIGFSGYLFKVRKL